MTWGKLTKFPVRKGGVLAKFQYQGCIVQIDSCGSHELPKIYLNNLASVMGKSSGFETGNRLNLLQGMDSGGLHRRASRGSVRLHKRPCFEESSDAYFELLSLPGAETNRSLPTDLHKMLPICLIGLTTFSGWRVAQKPICLGNLSDPPFHSGRPAVTDCWYVLSEST